MEGNDAARLNLTREQYNKPEFMQVYAPDGSVGLVDKKSIPLQGGIGVLPKGYTMPKLPQELTETQKLNHAAYLKHIAENGAPKTRGEADRIKALYGIGGGSSVGGLPDPYASPKGGLAAPSAPAPKVSPLANVEPMLVPFDRSSYERFEAAAQQGDPMGLAVIKGWLQTNQLPVGIRQNLERQYGN
jgi:hypothetical protein